MGLAAFRIRALSKGLGEARLEGMKGGESRVQPDFGSDNGVYQSGRGGGVGDDGDDESLHPGTGDIQW